MYFKLLLVAHPLPDTSLTLHTCCLLGPSLLRSGLHVLVNNAGIHLKPYKRVSCGFERTMASNYFGHWWLTHLLLNDLKQSAPARY